MPGYKGYKQPEFNYANRKYKYYRKDLRANKKIILTDHPI